MKLLLVNPFSPFLINPTAFPPLALLYVAAAAELDGCEVKVCDLASTDKFSDYSPDMIGVTACTPHIPILKELIESLWELYPGVPIILGGPHFSQRPKDGERFRADAVCIGDGEPVIRKFLSGGRGIITAAIQKIRVLPARHLIDLKRYHYKIAGLPATTMLTARGCPYSCAYCSRGPGYDTLRYNPLDLVEYEISTITKLGFKAIMLYDDELNISTRRLKGLCEVLKHAGVKWRGFIRSNLFTHEQARVMGDSGCVEVCCGVESGSDAILKLCNKKATVKDATNARHLAGFHGLRFKAFCMIGLPGETEATVEQTRQWLLTNRPDDFALCPYTPYPGSAVSENPGKYGIVVDQDYWYSTYYHKGKPGEYQPAAHTKALSAARIAELRDQIEKEVRNAL